MFHICAYDAFGTLTKIRSLNAEGVLAEAETALSHFLYAGEQYDAVTGLYYLRARQYDTVVGRFTQEDTYLGDGRNLYVYVQNNPLKYVDPSGYCSKKELLEKINSPYIEMSNTALELYDPVAEQERKESWERTKQGAVSVIKGAAAVTAGVIVIACMPAAAPALLQTVVSTVSLTSAGMGLYDVSEGVQDVYYGLSGDANSQSVHPIKDYYFHGNQAAYNKAEMMLQVGTALGGLGTLAFSPTITAGNVANYANMMEQGLDFFDAVEESSGNTGNRSETVATVEELMQMMNQRDRVTARFAVGDELEYLISQEAEASHMLMEDGSSDLIFRKDSSTRWTLFHEWLHRYLQNKNGSYMPGEDNYIEDFLERHKEFLKLDTKKIYEVDKIYVIEDKKYIIVHLKEKAWEHCQHKEIGLVIGNKKYLFQYVGFGNINGTLAIRLIPLKNVDISELDRQKNRRMFIEVTNYK